LKKYFGTLLTTASNHCAGPGGVEIQVSMIFEGPYFEVSTQGGRTLKRVCVVVVVVVVVGGGGGLPPTNAPTL
jgi:hypothetical protein